MLSPTHLFGTVGSRMLCPSGLSPKHEQRAVSSLFLSTYCVVKCLGGLHSITFVVWRQLPYGGSVSAPGIFFDPCLTSDLLGGALSALRAQCNYLDVEPS